MVQFFIIELDLNIFDYLLVFLVNGGVVGKLLFSFDVVSLFFGLLDVWLVSLKIMMVMLLLVKVQIVLFWGVEFVVLYNDVYVLSIGDKYLCVFGWLVIENWWELWDDFELLLCGVYEIGEIFVVKDWFFYIECYGCGEMVYFDVFYLVVWEIDGFVGGVLCIVIEIIEWVCFECCQVFFLELGQILLFLVDFLEIEVIVLCWFGEELGVLWIFFGEDNGDGMIFQVYCDYFYDGCLVVGWYCYLLFGVILFGELYVGCSVVWEDFVGECGMSFDEVVSCVCLGLGVMLYVLVLCYGWLEVLLVIYFVYLQVFGEDLCCLVEEVVKLVWILFIYVCVELVLCISFV